MRGQFPTVLWPKRICLICQSSIANRMLFQTGFLHSEAALALKWQLELTEFVGTHLWGPFQYPRKTSWLLTTRLWLWSFFFLFFYSHCICRREFNSIIYPQCITQSTKVIGLFILLTLSKYSAWYKSSCSFYIKLSRLLVPLTIVITCLLHVSLVY